MPDHRDRQDRRRRGERDQHHAGHAGRCLAPGHGRHSSLTRSPRSSMRSSPRRWRCSTRRRAAADHVRIEVEPSRRHVGPAPASPRRRQSREQRPQVLGPGRTVEIEIDRADGGRPPELEVRDHGMGLSTEEATSVFERFARADRARARGIPGLGLGLYACSGHHRRARRVDRAALRRARQRDDRGRRPAADSRTTGRAERDASRGAQAQQPPQDNFMAARHPVRPRWAHPVTMPHSETTHRLRRA